MKTVSYEINIRVKYLIGWFGWYMVFNATFNNISAISWRSV